jgi:hypothetical protein
LLLNPPTSPPSSTSTPSTSTTAVVAPTSAAPSSTSSSDRKSSSPVSVRLLSLICQMAAGVGVLNHVNVLQADACRALHTLITNNLNDVLQVATLAEQSGGNQVLLVEGARLENKDGSKSKLTITQVDADGKSEAKDKPAPDSRSDHGNDLLLSTLLRIACAPSPTTTAGPTTISDTQREALSSLRLILQAITQSNSIVSNRYGQVLEQSQVELIETLIGSSSLFASIRDTDPDIIAIVATFTALKAIARSS